LGKDNKKISMSQCTLAWGLPSIKDQENTSACFRGIGNLKL